MKNNKFMVWVILFILVFGFVMYYKKTASGDVSTFTLARSALPAGYVKSGTSFTVTYSNQFSTSLSYGVTYTDTISNSVTNLCRTSSGNNAWVAGGWLSTSSAPISSQTVTINTLADANGTCSFQGNPNSYYAYSSNVVGATKYFTSQIVYVCEDEGAVGTGCVDANNFYNITSAVSNKYGGVCTERKVTACPDGCNSGSCVLCTGANGLQQLALDSISAFALNPGATTMGIALAAIQTWAQRCG